MSDHAELAPLEIPGPLRAPTLVVGSLLCIALGAIAFLVCLFLDPMRAWGAVLVGLMVPLMISAGATCFIAMHSIGGARWTVPLQRLMEGLGSGFLPSMAGVLLLVAFGHGLYDWGSTDARGSLFHIHDGQKSHWMTTMRVLLTSLASLGAWSLLRLRLNRLSQASSGHSENIKSHARWSVAFLIIFSLSFTLLMWDLLLGLQARFISTTWGFYCFVSALQIFLAVLSLVVAWLAKGPLHAVIRPHLVRDLGTWTVAWSCIWAYIAYTQYIIIYFANTNEESYFYLMRLQHGYQYGIILESVLRFPVPFLVLLSQRMRGNLARL